MKQSKLLIETLKSYLRHRGITYSALAKAMGQSESNIKRIFSQEAFSLDALEEMCEVAGIELLDLARLSRKEKEDEVACFTQVQETELAADPKLFAVLYLLLSGVRPGQISSRYDITGPKLGKCLLTLDKLGLLRLHPNDRVQLLISKNIRWISNGPLNQLYREQIKKEFLDCDFSRLNERMRFLNGQLSKRSIQSLSRRIDRLIAEFVDLAEDDKTALPEETHGIWFMIAYRPWNFSVVKQFRKKNQDVRSK